MEEEATPVVDPEVPEELEPQEVEETEPGEPIAEAEQAESTDRRSRRAGKREATPKQTVDLSELEEFRKWQVEADRRFEQERQRRIQLETQQQQRFEQESNQRLQYLRQAVAEADDPEERQRAVDEILQISSQLAQYGGQQYVEQLQKWEAWKANEIKSRGLDPADTRFTRQYSSGQQGLAEFMADLTTAENDKLKKELAQARKSSDPATIAALVRKEMAKLAAESGYDTVDLAEPERAASNQQDAWERDTALFNAGRMSGAAYLKKWGGG